MPNIKRRTYGDYRSQEREEAFGGTEGFRQASEISASKTPDDSNAAEPLVIDDFKSDAASQISLDKRYQCGNAGFGATYEVLNQSMVSL